MKSQNRYETLINNLNVGIFRVAPDPDSPLREINPAMVHIFQAPSREALLSIPRRKLFADEQATAASAGRLLKTGAKVDEFMEFRRYTGETFWASVTAVKVTDDEGNVYFDGALTDVTPRKHADEALRDSEHLFRGLLESAPDAVLIADRAGRIVLVNPQAERLFGYEKGRLAGRTVEDLVPGHLGDRHADQRRSYFAAPRTRAMGGDVVLWGRRKDGSQFPAEIALSPVETKGGLLVMSVVRDITERSATEARFRAVAETANDGVVSIDSRGDIIYFNKAAERLFGYDNAEVMRQPLTRLMPERHRPAHRQGLQRFISTRAPRIIGRSVEMEGLHKDGHEFPLELSISHWQIGEDICFTGIVRDITTRRYNEQQIIDLNERLLRRTEALENVNQELEAFSYSVSHDLRAPLRAIDGFSQVLLEDYSQGLDEQGRHCLNRIRSNAQHMGALIDDLLKLSRVTRAGLNPQDVDLSALVREVWDELTTQGPAGQNAITVMPGLRARGDAPLLRVAVQNLLENACKFSSKRDDPRIEFGAAQQDGDTVYYVKDNGVGFDERYADKLFSAFQRLHHASDFPGTGIGLATVKRVVVRHGGKIWAHSAVGEGAAFYFTLHAS